MKKIILFLSFSLVSIILVSCRNDGETDNQSNNANINPPSWIKGKWKLNTNNFDQYYTFTDNDIIIQSGGITTNLKLNADYGNYSQTSSDTKFTYSLHLMNIKYTYQFKKVNSTKMLYDNQLGGDDYENWSEYIKK